jgi:hypothetical protein
MDGLFMAVIAAWLHSWWKVAVVWAVLLGMGIQDHVLPPNHPAPAGPDRSGVPVLSLGAPGRNHGMQWGRRLMVETWGSEAAK